MSQPVNPPRLEPTWKPSRRQMLQLLGGLGALLATPSLAGARAAARPALGTGRRDLSCATAPGVQLQFPFWADTNWDQPQYYQTIQLADVNGDGQAELLARSNGGIETHVFDLAAQQFASPVLGPALTDAGGWDQPSYYETIRTADIDGDGRDELLARSAVGISVWKLIGGAWTTLPDGPALSDAAGWGVVQYYSTIQLGDIDGDGRDELLARGPGGIEVWKFAGGAWMPLPDGPALSDAGGWNLPQYYETIRLADIDGDGRDELLARSAVGISVWKFIGGAWTTLPNGPAWSDAAGWDEPDFFGTIQLADIDGDGQAELLARGAGGITAWKFTGGAWTQLPDGPALSDAGGWNLPQYYETIRLADVDGDGREELFVRGAAATSLWKFTGGGWTQLANGPPWTDAAGWDQVQYYSTIRVGDIDGDGRAELVARGPNMTEVWKFDPFDPSSPHWFRTTKAFPQFSGDQLTAYQALTATLIEIGGLSDTVPAGTDLRSLYGSVLSGGTLTAWIAALTAGTIPAPAGVSSDDWQAVTTQIQREVVALGNAIDYLGLINMFYTDTFVTKSATVTDVSDTLQLDEASQQSNTWWVDTIQLVGDALWGASGFLGIVSPLVGAIGSTITGTLAGGLTFLNLIKPGKYNYPFLGDVAQLSEQISNQFTDFLCAHAALTVNVLGDWGLLQVYGGQLWDDTVESSLQVATIRGYELWIWQGLTPLVWKSDFANHAGGVPSKYPADAVVVADGKYCYVATRHTDDSANPAQLATVFGSGDGDLNQAPSDVVFGYNGWALNKVDGFPPLGSEASSSNSVPAVAATLALSDLRAEIRTARRQASRSRSLIELDVQARLSRDARGDIAVDVALHNRGALKLTNVEVTAAHLGLEAARTHDRRHRLVQTALKRTLITFAGGAGRAERLLRLEIRFHAVHRSFRRNFKVVRFLKVRIP